MGNVYADITLENMGDVTNVQRGIIPENGIRSLSVTALVDTGAGTLVISEDTRVKLGLTVHTARTATLAGGRKEDCKITEPVRIVWKDRDTVCRAWVLPGEDETLLGVIPLEDMDLIVDPRRRELAGAHGNAAMGRIK